MAHLKPADKYYIDFSTQDGPGLLAVTVKLDSEYVTDIDATMRIDLAAHPLYANLERYVLSNPSGKKPR